LNQTQEHADLSKHTDSVVHEHCHYEAPVAKDREDNYAEDCVANQEHHLVELSQRRVFMLSEHIFVVQEDTRIFTNERRVRNSWITISCIQAHSVTHSRHYVMNFRLLIQFAWVFDKEVNQKEFNGHETHGDHKVVNISFVHFLKTYWV